MAEFCLTCWNKTQNIPLQEKNVVISKELDLCEGCGKMKQVIVCTKKGWLIRYVRYLIFRK